MSSSKPYEEPLKSTVPSECVLHPLVLLSAVDHYNRVAKNTSKRVIGIILGQYRQGIAHITSSFAIPFEEDLKDSSSWYIDHNYIEEFITLHRKVTTTEHIMGWYSSDTLLTGRDLDIHEVIRSYIAEPIFLKVNINDVYNGQGGSDGIANTVQYNAPAHAYCSIPLSKDDIQTQLFHADNEKNNNNNNNDDMNENVGVEGSTTTTTTTKIIKKKKVKDDQLRYRHFVHVNITVKGDEAEEIGVEHILRNIQQNKPLIPTTNADGERGTRSIASTNDILTSKLTALYGLQEKMKNIEIYLNYVISGKLSYNVAVINRIQDIISLMPVVTSGVLKVALDQHTNDSILVIYVNSIVNTISALHNLIKNKELLAAASTNDEVKRALIKSTKTTANQKDKNVVEYNIDSVAHDRGDHNK